MSKQCLACKVPPGILRDPTGTRGALVQQLCHTHQGCQASWWPRQPLPAARMPGHSWKHCCPKEIQTQ